jgi:hypothetical protein
LGRRLFGEGAIDQRTGAGRLAGAALWLLALCVAVPAAQASENGTFSDFPVGAQTLADAFLPPPGATEFYGYFLYYAGNSVRDGAGHAVRPGIKVDVFAQAPRVVHTWKFALGPIHVSSGLVAETDYLKLKIAGQHYESTGLDEFGVEPFDLTASYGNWYFLSGTHFYITAWPYDRNSAANASSHYSSIAQQFGITWLPTPRWDISLNPNVEFNDRNHATGYRSGNSFGFTYGVSYRPCPHDLRWDVGVNGFVIDQLEGDRSYGVPVPGGNKLRKQGIGPQLAYWFTPGAVLLVKWQHEMAVRNGPQGDLYWVEFAFPI